MARRAATLSVESFLAGLEDPTIPEDEATTAMLDATSALLATYGLRRWTMDDVAERSGLARATVYRRFDSRDDLVHAALRRHARRLFEAVAGAVAHVATIEDKVVEGILVGLRLVRESLVSDLFASDTGTARSLLTSAPVLALARTALVERYRVLTGADLSVEDATEAELVAEALVRLGVSFVLMPDSVVDFDDQEAARQSVRRIVGPLLALPPVPDYASKRIVTSRSSTPRTTVNDRTPSSPTPSTAPSRPSMEPTG